MRNFFPNKVAEAQQAEVDARDAILATPMLSMEEQMLETGELEAQANALTADLNEANRVVELSDALESIADIADAIPRADEHHAALIEAAGTAAVAGTDIMPEELVPSMESYVGNKLAAASQTLRATAKQIWQRIMEFIERVWDGLEKFFYRLLGDVPRLRRTLTELEDKLKELKDNQAADTLEVTGSLNALCVNYKPVADGAELEKSVKDLQAAVHFAYNDLAGCLVSRGKSIEAAIKAFEPAKAEDCAQALVASLNMEKFPKQPGAGSPDLARNPGYCTVIGAGLLGNKSLSYRHYEENKDHSVLGSLDRKRQSYFDLVDTSERAPQAPVDKVVLHALSVAEMKNMISVMFKILDDVEKYQRGGKRHELEQQAKHIKLASAEAEKKLEAFKVSTSSEERNAVEYYRAVLNFNVAFASWSARSSLPVSNHTLRSLRAVIIVIHKSIAAHMNVKPAPQAGEPAATVAV